MWSVWFSIVFDFKASFCHAHWIIGSGYQSLWLIPSTGLDYGLVILGTIYYGKDKFLHENIYYPVNFERTGMSFRNLDK